MAKSKMKKVFKSAGFDYEKVMMGFIGLTLTVELLENIKIGYDSIGVGDGLEPCIEQLRDAITEVIVGMEVDSEEITKFMRENIESGRIKISPMDTSCQNTFDLTPDVGYQ